MFEALSASFPGATWRARAITSALLLHGVLISLAITGTAASSMGAPEPARDTIRVDLAIVDERPHNATPTGPARLIPSAPAVPNQPTTVPTLDLPQLDFRGPVTTVPPLTALRATLGTGSFGVPDSALSPFRSSEVDELPRLITDLHPEYPDVLRRAGVSGAVEVEYVVGKDGRITPASLQVLTSDHGQFAGSVVRALRAARFRAARRAGKPVAVLVRQTVRFRSETP